MNYQVFFAEGNTTHLRRTVRQIKQTARQAHKSTLQLRCCGRWSGQYRGYRDAYMQASIKFASKHL